jgi:hypothetical protein
MLPEGLHYIDSWIVVDDVHDRCYQLMETENPALFDIWSERWRDLVRFEIYPIIRSGQMLERWRETT